MTKYFAALFFLALIVSSCATILNKKEVTLRLYAEDKNAEVAIDDSIIWDKASTSFRAERRAKSLIIFYKDSLGVATSKVRFKVSKTFFPGNFLSPYCIGFPVDLFAGKMFTYDPAYYLKRDNNGTLKISPKFTPSKGQLNLKIAAALFSNQQMASNADGGGTETGIGLLFSQEYYFTQKHFLSPGIGFFISLESSTYKIHNAAFLLGTDYNRFQFMGGLQFAKQTNNSSNERWRAKNQHTTHSMGLAIATAYQLGYWTHLTVNYRPQILHIQNKQFRASYQPLLILSLDYKLKFSKKGKYPFW